MQRRALVAGLAAALAAPLAVSPGPASAATRIALADVFLLLEPYLALKPDKRDRFSLAYRVLRAGKPAPDVKASFVHRDHTTTPMALDPDGWVTQLPTLEQLKDRESFEVDGPSFDMAIELRATLAPAARLPVAELTAALAQANAAMVSFSEGDPGAGQGLTCVYFPGAAGARAILPAGERPLPSFDFKLIGPTLYFEPHAMPGAAAIAFDKPPSRIVLAPPPRR